MNPVIKLILLMSLLSIFGCGGTNPTQTQDPANDGPVRLDSFYYTATHGYRGFTNRGYHADRLKDGSVRITVELGDDRDRISTADASFMDSLEAIVREFRMDKYKENYKPRFDVKDGDSWSFRLKYSDGKTINSGGYFELPPNGHEAFEKVEKFFAPCINIEPEDNKALVSFRYELYTEKEGSEVFWLKKGESRDAIYFRLLGKWEGWNYYCADPKLLEEIAEELRDLHACSYCGEDLSKEDKSRPRWISIIEYADGRTFELIDYLDRDHENYRHMPPTNFERRLRYIAETLFQKEIERIGTLPPEELGEHSLTTYDSDGKPSRTMNYAGDGTVLNGYDYNNPMLDF